jgi:hypothetical protein
MKIPSLVLAYLLAAQLLNAQGSKTEKQVKCSDILKQLTSEWKADSLSITGYRFNYFHALSESKPDSLSTKQLLNYLDRPNIIRKSTSGRPRRNHVEYVYVILNDDPTGKVKPFVGLYLSFVFVEDEDFLEEISAGEFCR